VEAAAVNWHITVKPTSDALTEWKWIAEGDDGESVLAEASTYSTWEAAMDKAKERVLAEAARRQTISDATKEEDYTPSQAEILAVP